MHVATTSRAQETEHDRALREGQDQRAAEKAASEKAVADQKDREKREMEDACGKTRPQRLADLKKQVEEYTAEFKKRVPHLDWMAKHCKYEDTRGDLVQRQHTSEGVIIRTKQVGKEAEAKCDAARPKGLTMEMVEFYLDFDPDEQVALYNGQHFDENRRCVEVDRAAGTDFFVKTNDVGGLTAIRSKQLPCASGEAARRELFIVTPGLVRS